jgi:hypothetical protein
MHLSHRFNSVSNLQHRSLLTVVSATSPPPFQPLHHQRNICHVSWPSFEPLYVTLRAINGKHFFTNTLCIESFCPQKNAQQTTALQWWYTPQAQSPFWLLKPASEYTHAHLLPRLSWSWTVLLPNDTHRKPITSITAVLLPFVTCLLTPSYILKDLETHMVCHGLFTPVHSSFSICRSEWTTSLSCCGLTVLNICRIKQVL